MPPNLTAPPTGRRWTPAAAVAVRVVVACCLLTALAANALPAIAKLRGDQLLIVLSGSMTPTFRAGDAVLVAHPAEGALRPGMVVAFDPPGSARLKTHRIVGLHWVDGRLFLQTQGDANASPDPDFTPASSVVGVMGAAYPQLGRALSLAQSALGKVVLLGGPLLALLLEQLLVAPAGGRRRSGRPPRAPGRVLVGGVGEPGRRLVPRAGHRRWTRPTAIALVLLAAGGGGVAAARTTGATFTGSRSQAGNTFSTGSFCGSGSTYNARVVQDHPSLYYRLGEATGTAAADDATTPHAGVYQAAPTLAQSGAINCDANTAVSFNGTSQYLTNAFQVAAPNTLTIETWFRTSTGGGKLVGYGSSVTGSSGSYDRQVYLTTAGQLIFGVWNGGAKVVTSPATYLDNHWHLVDCTFGALGLHLFVDGVEVASDASSTVGQSYTGSWRVAHDSLASWPSAGGNYFKGLMDEVAIFPTQLSAATVAAHYAANPP